MPVTEYKSFHPKTRKAWRQWLEKNHQKAPGIWMVFYKAESGKPRVPYDDAVEEALCFGWIDSLPRKLDAERSMLKFTPRKPKSVWSQLNKQRVTKLIQAGQMMPAGMTAIQRAKENGSWETLSVSDQHAAANTIPKDLAEMLKRNKKAGIHFQQFSMSIRKQFLSWIDSAKKPETRNARLEQTVRMAEANRKPGLKGFQL
ncbi:MAG: YdeI/OmpD-associated family protein [Chitinophagaceae bacterium]|nr:YdeI/OmpD-associated family protein [Chitinophagaceae bacterium]MBP8244072.1 YdeI/OmpD-associated family protein [Chitinophagaceae bacterium]